MNAGVERGHARQQSTQRRAFASGKYCAKIDNDCPLFTSVAEYHPRNMGGWVSSEEVGWACFTGVN